MRKLRTIFMMVILSLFFLVPVHASNTEYVRDDYGLLSSSETTTLESLAKSVSQKYNVGVYIRVENDYTGYSSIQNYAEAVYADEQLGSSYNGNVVMFLITMEDRSYRLLTHGSTANAAFTDYGQKQIASDVVSYLKNDNYYDGFQKFVTDCDQYLKAQQAGTPVDTWIPDSSYDEAAHQQTMSYIRYGVTFAGAPLIALIVCLIIKAKNKTAGIKYEAQNYVPKNGVNVTGMQDIFLYRTETVTHINRDHGGGGGHFGGTSINSGGFSGTSGHF